MAVETQKQRNSLLYNCSSYISSSNYLNPLNYFKEPENLQERPLLQYQSYLYNPLNVDFAKNAWNNHSNILSKVFWTALNFFGSFIFINPYRLTLGNARTYFANKEIQKLNVDIAQANERARAIKASRGYNVQRYGVALAKAIGFTLAAAAATYLIGTAIVMTGSVLNVQSMSSTGRVLTSLGGGLFSCVTTPATGLLYSLPKFLLFQGASLGWGGVKFFGSLAGSAGYSAVSTVAQKVFVDWIGGVFGWAGRGLLSVIGSIARAIFIDGIGGAFCSVGRGLAYYLWTAPTSWTQNKVANIWGAIANFSISAKIAAGVGTTLVVSGITAAEVLSPRVRGASLWALTGLKNTASWTVGTLIKDWIAKKVIGNWIGKTFIWEGIVKKLFCTFLGKMVLVGGGGWCCKSLKDLTCWGFGKAVGLISFSYSRAIKPVFVDGLSFAYKKIRQIPVGKVFGIFRSRSGGSPFTPRRRDDSSLPSSSERRTNNSGNANATGGSTSATTTTKGKGFGGTHHHNRRKLPAVGGNMLPVDAAQERLRQQRVLDPRPTGQTNQQPLPQVLTLRPDAHMANATTTTTTTTTVATAAAAASTAGTTSPLLTTARPVPTSTATIAAPTATTGVHNQQQPQQAVLVPLSLTGTGNAVQQQTT